jgi:hypothetical protein
MLTKGLTPCEHIVTIRAFSHICDCINPRQ